MIPTNIISIETSDLEVDFLCLLEDETYLHLEFQTTTKGEDLDRFMKYDALLYDRYKKPVRTVIVFGADVKDAIESKSYGSIFYQPEFIFLSNQDGDALVKDLWMKVENGESLSNADMGKLILLPLMKTEVKRSERVLDSAQIASKIPDKDMQTKVLSFIITISHKFLSEDETNKMLEVIEMTPLYEEITKRSQAEALDNVFKAIELLREHKEIDYIAEKTHLPKERIISLKRQIQQ
ncbi:hypothetical protein [Terrilactibacillus laevilacticus]|uniref:Transposase (putative) YhgA-like domain-containing protein n=1 Tax=Terrilactibacillus laevilacticus TaxID=1380157 RepID=A0ABW5PSH1_9BACI|nr:hypothetical protein [Terrilactibacillus laevilacticus]